MNNSAANDDLTQFNLEIDRRIAERRASWNRNPKEPIPLSEAYRLLDDAALRRGWVEATLDLVGHAPRETSIFGGRFPPRLHGQLAIPAFENTIKHLWQTVRQEIEAGTIILAGIEAGKELRGKSNSVPAERIALLHLDFETNAALIDGRVASKMLSVSRPKPSAKVRANPTSEADLREFMARHHEQWDEKGKIPPLTTTYLEAKAKMQGITRDRVIKARKALIPQWSTKRGPKGPRARQNSAK
jgi:hypothetical protein